MPFQPQLAFQPLHIQESFQNEALQKTLRYLHDHSAFYKRMFAEHAIDINAIKTVHDLKSLPTTCKNDIQMHNWEFLCVSDLAIREYTSTSGTMGKPVTIALTENDLKRLAFNEQESFLCADGKEADIYQLMLTLDRQFMAGMAYYSGIRKIGAAVVRTGPGIPDVQWDTILKLQTTSLVTVPSFLLKLVDYATAKGLELNKMPVMKAVCIGENIRTSDFELNALGQAISERWPIKLYSTYASTEMQTAFTECSAGNGAHHQPALIILEILNEHNDIVQPGEYGEVTITTLGVEGMPLLRYRTGDICAYYDSPCSCGRHSRRLSPVLGRKQQMIKYKGTTLYPPAIFDILNQMPAIEEYVVEVYTGAMETDEIRVHYYSPMDEEKSALLVRPVFQSKLRVTPDLVPHNKTSLQQMQFPEGSRKQVKFLDNRGF